MKPILLALAILTAMPALAQTRVLVGADAGQDFNNQFAGAILGIEQPFAHRIEADLYERPSPIESHLGLGTGFANAAQGGGIVWLTKHIGTTATIEKSQYDVTSAEKSAYYIQIGPVVRLSLAMAPSRIIVNYAHQILNGISANGSESSHLNGFSVLLDSRVSCAKWACLRLKESFDVGHVLEQGNPANDSPAAAIASGQTYHPRIGAWSGGFTFSATVEFSRRDGRDRESELF